MVSASQSADLQTTGSQSGGWTSFTEQVTVDHRVFYNRALHLSVDDKIEKLANTVEHWSTRAILLLVAAAGPANT